MDDAFTVSLLIYSGRENPIVSISETEFDIVFSLVKSQQKKYNSNFGPNLGDIGFSFYSNSVFINIYKNKTTIETKFSITSFMTNSEILKTCYCLFFKLYRGDDLKDLQTMVNNYFFVH